MIHLLANFQEASIGEKNTLPVGISKESDAQTNKKPRAPAYPEKILQG